MLSAGVADVVLKFLQSEMPPVQFKLLGTLRMLIDTQGGDFRLSICTNILTLSSHTEKQFILFFLLLGLSQVKCI